MAILTQRAQRVPNPPRLARVVATGLLLCAGWTAGVQSPSRAQGLPAGFTVERVIGEPFASLPIGFAFLPDGRILLLEKNGNVRLAAVGSTASTIVATVPNLSTQGERGLLGVAVDPTWPTRPYVGTGRVSIVR